MLLTLITRFTSILLASVVTLMVVQVVLRFGFNAPQAWAEEVDRYMFVWSVYLGSIIALVKGTHIRVTFLVDWLGPKFEKPSRLLGTVVNFLSFTFVSTSILISFGASQASNPACC